MKKLYRKGTVHPSSSVVSDQLLSFLPAAILALTVALSPEDREVLAYLISCSGSHSNTQRKANQKAAAAGGPSSKGNDDHPPCFGCNCFRCYLSYWAKWNSSPNRQLIDEIIDAFEDNLFKGGKKEKNKKEKRKEKSVKGKIELQLDVPKKSDLCLTKGDFHFGGESSSAAAAAEGGADAGNDEEVTVDGDVEKGSVRKIVNFLGERMFKLWG